MAPRPPSASRRRDGDTLPGPPGVGHAALGLPSPIRACLFDMDGVLTRTAELHTAAWKEMFDEYLRKRSLATGKPFVPFDAASDYDGYVDGKLRVDGARSFLASRGIHLPDGEETDPPDAETVSGLANRKDEIFVHLLRRDGVGTYDGSVRYVRAVRHAGLRTAVVSSSKHCHDVLVSAGIADLFDERIDGISRQRGPPGRQAGAGHVPRGGSCSRGHPGRGGRLRGCAFRRRGRTGGALRLRRRRRPHRASGRASPPWRRHGSDRSRRAPGAGVIQHPSFRVEPWALHETALTLDVLAQTESLFALSNGHVGLRGNLDEGEPHGLPGSYLNGFYELRPLPQAESRVWCARVEPDTRQRDERQAVPLARRRRAVRRALRRAAARTIACSTFVPGR